MPKNIETCPCGSRQPYAQCCAPFHQGDSVAPIAEALMRSRYTAYVLALKDYLLATWHSTTRPKQLQLDSNTQWLGLKVKACEAGQIEDQKGTVSFIARYKIQGKAHRLTETSRFVKEQGRWFYVDGDIGDNNKKV
ncbi:YchJ family metal-binding protein [Candidatus Albibeggiatoa sp. nov. NOAA]|uniref:YchJ family protein n=1 Tax=Candidatus Albibeggiatoa sp. nov. NOAA TaxID=3162724 RepID=UPI0032FC6AB9|nr:YchJ family metal-binding protein [Thiotrichaceae bacterium]